LQLEKENLLQQNNDDDVVVAEKINTNGVAPPTEVSISHPIYQRLNDLLDQLHPDFEEKARKRQHTIEQILLLGINTKLKSIQQHQHQQCSFAVDGKTPRPDVLDNYAKLAFVLESGENFPLYGEKFLRTIIQSSLGVSDSRTVAKYFRGILEYSTKRPHESGYNVEIFCDSFPKSLKVKASQILDDSF
jgi:hypothetical protein